MAHLRRSYLNPIVILRAIVDEGCQPWKLSLVGKFLGRSISLDKVHLGLSVLWNLQSDWEIFLMAYGYFISHFTSPSDLDRVLFDGPWVLDNVALALGHWTLDFRPSPQSLLSVAVWMGLPDPPPALWNRFALDLIVAAVGRLIKLDEATQLLSKGRFVEGLLSRSILIDSLCRFRCPLRGL